MDSPRHTRNRLNDLWTGSWPIWVVALLVLILGAGGLFLNFDSPAFQPTSPILAEVRGVYFSPNGGATEAIVNEISAARTCIYVQAYSFTSAPIAQALVDAHRRGVPVTVILDKSQRTEHYSSATFLAHAGIPVYIDAVHSIAHNKIILIDNAIVITGSFNFTKAAEEHNAENLLILSGATLYPLYYSNFQSHLSHSERYTS